MDGCSNELQLDHSERISKLESRTEVLSEIFKLTKDLHITLIQIASDNGKMLTAIETQGSALEKQGRVQEKMLEEMDTMREMMANKDSLTRVHTKIEELETDLELKVVNIKTELDDIKNIPARQALQEKNSFKKWLLAAVGAIIASQYLPDIIKLILS